MALKISGCGSALPEKILTNKDLEKIVDTTDEWIRERTGICERHIAEKETVVSLASEACIKALDDAKRSPKEVELILLATCSPQMLLPCSAAQVQSVIGADNAVAFDINAACSGFLFALQTANAYLTSGIYNNALIVGSEVLSKLIDWNDRSSCVLFGDGAGAVFVENGRDDGRGILGMVQGCDGGRGDVLYCRDRIYISASEDRFDKEDLFIHMNGGEVYKFAVRQVPDCIEKVLCKAGVSASEVDMFILHQANIRIIEAIAKRLDTGMERFPVNLSRVGNTSSAAIPLLLDELKKNDKIKSGQLLVLSGFGAGLTYGACVLRW
ncbi:MAG: ketoacyl-ACP synthase III [Lachnospiraceae bacterium]|nr:ketoacyl-ACP synthase III [Lachnospiraceae bacterium]